MTKRAYWQVVFAVALLQMTATSEAALLSRLSGLAYYDDVREITWLGDANLAASNSFGVGGIGAGGAMRWDKAVEWVAAMNSASYLGVTDWRLPTTLLPDPSCSHATEEEPAWGLDCVGSEMGSQYYVNGVTASAPSPFSNLKSAHYWSGTAHTAGATWVFGFDNGAQTVHASSANNYVWAVRNGDIAATVPAPAAGWLFSGGLGALGWLRRWAR